MYVFEKENYYISEAEINQIIIESQFKDEIREYRYYTNKTEKKIAGVSKNE